MSTSAATRYLYGVVRSAMAFSYSGLGDTMWQQTIHDFSPKRQLDRQAMSRTFLRLNLCHIAESMSWRCFSLTKNNRIWEGLMHWNSFSQSPLLKATHLTNTFSPKQLNSNVWGGSGGGRHKSASHPELQHLGRIATAINSHQHPVCFSMLTLWFSHVFPNMNGHLSLTGQVLPSNSSWRIFLCSGLKCAF